MKHLIDAYNALPLEKQEEYRNRTRDPALDLFEEKHKIPTLMSYRPHLVYLRATKQYPITPEKFKLYGKLPKKEQELYAKKAERLNVARKKELHRFLGRLGLSEKEFEHIQRVCSAVKEVANKVKLFKANKAEKARKLAVDAKKKEEALPQKEQNV